MTHAFEFWFNTLSCLFNTVNWKSYVRQKILLNESISTAMTSLQRSTLVKGKIAPVTVGHIPRELSRYVWYAMMEGAKFDAVVHEEKANPPWKSK